LSGLIGTASHPVMQKNPDNWIFLWKFAIYLRTNKTLFGWLQSTSTANEDFRNSLSGLGTPSSVTIYSMYLRINLPTTPDMKF